MDLVPGTHQAAHSDPWTPAAKAFRLYVSVGLMTPGYCLQCQKYSIEGNRKIFHMEFFFYSGFLSWTFMIHRIEGKGGGYFFNSSLPLPPALQTF